MKTNAGGLISGEAIIGRNQKIERMWDILDLLWQDHYIARDASSGRRKYGFLYKLMRRWWLANRG